MDNDTSLYSTARYAALQIALQLMTGAAEKWSVSDLVDAAGEIEDFLKDTADVD